MTLSRDYLSRPGPPVSARGDIPPFQVMDVIRSATQLRARGRDVIMACAGQPATPAPTPVRAAAEAALRSDDALGYTPAAGIMALREAICQHYLDSYQVPVDPTNVAITNGSSAAFTAIFLAAFDPGDVVLMARPGYPAYRNSLAALGVEVVELDCGEQVRYQPTVQLVTEYAHRSGRLPAGLIVASPANPTGTIIEPAEFAALATWCADNSVLLISDEIYHGITFGGLTPQTALTLSPDAVVVGSMSKYFSMTGWRVGWAVLPDALVRPVDVLLGNLNICAPAIGQMAAVAAFTADADRELREHVRRYAANRDLVIGRLGELGVTRWAPADGAFYAYADISHLTSDSYAWCCDALEATGVAVTPGVDFAPTRAGSSSPLDGAGWFRISLAGYTEELDEVMTRLAEYVASATS